ncbi:hypothetical protein J6590_064668 [Homalodisca vitripennis]|nr:hypothetical protein J6590_064668 [Homalodisca vitripennis]
MGCFARCGNNENITMGAPAEWNRHLAPSIFSVVENMTLGHKKWTEECTDTAAPRIHRVQQVMSRACLSPERSLLRLSIRGP